MPGRHHTHRRRVAVPAILVSVAFLITGCSSLEHPAPTPQTFSAELTAHRSAHQPKPGKVHAGAHGRRAHSQHTLLEAFSRHLGRVVVPAPAPTWVPLAPAPGRTATPVSTPSASATATSRATPAPSSGTSEAPTPVNAAATAFAADSPFNLPIARSAGSDPRSAGMIAGLSADGAVANLAEFGIPIFEATSLTPRQQVFCTSPTGWGTCPLAGLQIPLGPGFAPNPGSDGAMVVIDRSAGLVYEFWQARHSGSGWSATWGSVSDLHGSGWGSTATGSGASRLGGVIRLSELQHGLIPHALALQTSLTCANVLRTPATKTDGTSQAPNCLPEGARVQLDPALDLNGLSLTPAERTVARALQTYGAYVMDTGGARLSVSFERASDASGTSPGAAYTALGLNRDYQSLKGIPWSKLRVLAG